MLDLIEIDKAGTSAGAKKGWQSRSRSGDDKKKPMSPKERARLLKLIARAKGKAKATEPVMGGYGMMSKRKHGGEGPNKLSSPKEIVGSHGHKSHGTSIRWPALYEHLRKKGMSKKKAAMISNGQWRKKHGLPPASARVLKATKTKAEEKADAPAIQSNRGTDRLMNERINSRLQNRNKKRRGSGRTLSSREMKQRQDAARGRKKSGGDARNPAGEKTGLNEEDQQNQNTFAIGVIDNAIKTGEPIKLDPQQLMEAAKKAKELGMEVEVDEKNKSIKIKLQDGREFSVVSKAGTAAGAVKGWITRRRGAPGVGSTKYMTKDYDGKGESKGLTGQIRVSNSKSFPRHEGYLTVDGKQKMGTSVSGKTIAEVKRNLDSKAQVHKRMKSQMRADGVGTKNEGITSNPSSVVTSRRRKRPTARRVKKSEQRLSADFCYRDLVP